MKTITDENGLSFELNTTLHTAKIVCSNPINKDVLIPRTINHMGQEYLITEAGEVFNSNITIKSVTFAEDSEIQKFVQYFFFVSNVEKITIPPKVSEFEPKFIIESDLKTIIVSPNNPYLKYLDDSHKVILSKSKSSQQFDTILFACRDIKSVIIPPYIKHIFPHAFDSCYDLKKIEISTDSQLETIGTCAFQHCSIKKIKFPKSLTFIDVSALFGTGCLKTCDFHLDSKITNLPDSLFSQSSVEIITIPREVRKLGRLWNDNVRI